MTDNSARAWFTPSSHTFAKLLLLMTSVEATSAPCTCSCADHSPSNAVNAEDTRIKFRSSDQVIFQVPLRNVEVHSGVLPGHAAEIPSDGIVDLEESSSVLTLFFQYFYPKKQPDLLKVSFEVLSALAEAVERYQVFSAMQTCKHHMEYASPPPSAFLL